MYHNTSRYLTHFYTAADNLMPKPSQDLNPSEFSNPYAVFQHARQKRMDDSIAAAKSNGAVTVDPKEMYPAELMRKYQILIVPESNAKPAQLRAIKAKDVRHAHTHATHTHTRHILPATACSRSPHSVP